MYFLGIDVGSSFLKSAILDLDAKKVVDSGRAPAPAFARTARTGAALLPENREIPIEELTEAVRGLIEEAAAKVPLAGAAFSVQMHGFMLFEKSGVPKTNYISWQDTRSLLPLADGQSAVECLKRDYAEELAEDGILLRPNHSAGQLFRFMRDHPDTKDAEFAMIGDGLVRMLTGARVPIHPTNAASSALYSLKENDWNRDFIEKLGFSGIDFPAAAETGGPLAVYESASGPVPLYAALGDQQATVLGIGAKAGDIFINIGTGGQVGFVTKEPVPGAYETRPYFDGTFIRTITQLPSGRMLNVLADLLADTGRSVFGLADEGLRDKVWAFMDSVDPEEEDENGALSVDLDFFEPEGGSITRIRGAGLNPGNLIRSAYKGIGETYRIRSGALGIPEDARGSVVCTGGVIRKNRPLFESIRRAFPMECRLAETEDDSMEGLLKYALGCLNGTPVLE